MADLQNPYRMLPTDDGGESYHMECVFCKEWGNILQSAPFRHTDDCPAGKLEQEEFAKMRAASKSEPPASN